MAGRIAYIVIGGAAIAGGMIYQGDLDLGWNPSDHIDVSIDRSVDRSVDPRVDPVVDPKLDRVMDHTRAVEVDPATERALAGAVAELVRAEASVISAKLDDNSSAAAIEQAEQRRDRAKQAVDQLADDARAGARGNRDALRQSIRDEVRDGVRDAIRS